MWEDNLMREDGELAILQFTNTFLLSLSVLRRVSVIGSHQDTYLLSRSFSYAVVLVHEVLQRGGSS